MSNKKLKDLSKKEYISLLKSGLFWEIFPDATGIYEYDVKRKPLPKDFYNPYGR